MSENNQGEKQDLDGTLGALLDFYSDRCTSHASFFLATFFGMFTILTLFENRNLVATILLTFSYILILAAGFYFLVSFKFYSDYSEEIKTLLLYPEDQIKSSIKYFHL